MGYTLMIGEHKFEFVVDSMNVDNDYSYISHSAISVKLDNAPAFGEPADYSNSRWPSYIGWYEAMTFVGLEDFMFNKSTGLLREHPGCVPLLPYHKAQIDKACEAFYKRYPNCKAGYSPKTQEDIFAEDKDWPLENGFATRLEWLKFWVDWALKNCEHPVFYNS